MAVQPNFWGTMASRERTASGRIRPQRETNSAERQLYRQFTPLPQKQFLRLPAEFFSDPQAEPERSAAVFSHEAHAVAEATEADSLARILAAIDGLMARNEDDGDVPATEHAYQAARAVVESAYGRLLAGEGAQADSLPVPTVTTDDRGGIKLSWESNDRHVRTNFAAAQDMRSYLYFESPAEHAIEALQPSVLSSRLKWMLGA
jgi:hypothetical protein